MINRFETTTYELNENESRAMELLIRSFNLNHIGKDKAMSNAFIAKQLEANGYGSMNSARVRKIINAIRHDGSVPCLLANSNGYYAGDDLHDIEEYISSLRQRSREIDRVADDIQEQLEKKKIDNI